MKFKKSILFSLTLFMSLMNISFLAKADTNPPYNYPFMEEKFLLLDSKRDSELPDRFRTIDKLNISGTSQFRPSQLDSMKRSINNPNIIVVDLRQESHGFLNDDAVSFSSFFQTINNNLDSSASEKSERKDLSKLPLNKDIPIFKNTGEYLESIKASIILNEKEVCKKNNLGYKRIAVRDNYIPTPEAVDEFIKFVNNLDKNTHLIFHCEAGEGRTTTFMSMYQMMKNTDNLSLEEILKEQVDAGGIVLTNSLSRKAFLSYFYTYTSENRSSNYKFPFSTWLKNNNINFF